MAPRRKRLRKNEEEATPGLKDQEKDEEVLKDKEAERPVLKDEEEVKLVLKNDADNKTDPSKGNDNSSSCGIIRFEVKNVSTLAYEGRFSEAVEVGGVPWKAMVRKQNDNKDKKDHLSIYLVSMSYKSSMWSIHTFSRHILVNDINSKNIKKQGRSCYEHHNNSWGYLSLIAWENLMNPAMGFITNDHITVEIHLTITSMKGIWISPFMCSADNRSNIVLMDEERKSVIVDKKTLFLNSDEACKGNHGFISFETRADDIGIYNMHSPRTEVLGESWSICVKKLMDRPHLETYLHIHNMSESSHWSMDVSVKFSLLNTQDTSQNLKQGFNCTLNHKNDNRGYPSFILWEDLVNEEKGFLKDGKITIEAQFTLSNVKGIRTLPFIDFSDSTDIRHDVALVLEKGKVYAGKQILAFHSTVFNSMFNDNFDEKNKKEIPLKDIDRTVFVQLLNLIYPSYQRIKEDNVEPLLQMADYFQIKKVIDQAEQFLIDSTNRDVPDKLRLSDRYRLVRLQEHCLGTFTTVKDITDMKSTDGYKALSDQAKSALMDKAMKLS